MPFAGFENWDACMAKMRKKYDEETAKKICGKLKHQYEDVEFPWDKCIAKMMKEYGSEEKAKKICGSIKAKYGDAFKRGSYDRCKKLAKRLGLSEEESHIYCSKFLSVKDAKKTGEEEFPEFSELTEKEKKEKKKKEMQKTAKITTPAGQRGASPKVKILREVVKSKPKYMQLPLYQPFRAMKSQNRLQTKMEIPTTLEQQFLTMEQLAKRAQYAVSIKKRDSYLIASDSMEIDAYEELDNIIKVPVTIAREMVQPYPKKDINGNRLRDANGNFIIEHHFKPYEELAKAIQYLDDFPVIIEHKKWNESDVVGYVRELEADSENRRLKGWAYLIKDKLPAFLLDRIRQRMVIPVSIGFWANVIREAGKFNGIPYDAIQRDFALDHLAICVYSIARCPPNQCGMNLDGEEIHEDTQIHTETHDGKVIIEDNEYYDINNDSEEKESKISNKKDGDKILDDAKPIIARSHSGEGKDITKLLAKLRDFLGIIPPEKKADAEDIILSIMELMLGDSNMEDSEIQEEIAKLKAEIVQLKDSLKIKEETISKKDELIDSLENEVKEKYIDTIKEWSTFEDSELKDKCLKELKVLADAAPKFKPSNKKPKTLSKGKHMEGRDQSDIRRLGPLSSKEDYQKYEDSE